MRVNKSFLGSHFCNCCVSAWKINVLIFILTLGRRKWLYREGVLAFLILPAGEAAAVCLPLFQLPGLTFPPEVAAVAYFQRSAAHLAFYNNFILSVQMN